MKIKRHFWQEIIISKISGFIYGRKNPAMKICLTDHLFLLILFLVLKRNSFEVGNSRLKVGHFPFCVLFEKNPKTQTNPPPKQTRHINAHMGNFDFFLINVWFSL